VIGDYLFAVSLRATQSQLRPLSFEPRNARKTFITFCDLSHLLYSPRCILLRRQKSDLLLQFPCIFLLELNISLVRSAPIIAKETPKVDLVQGITMREVSGTGKSDVQSAIAPNQFKMHSIQIATSWMEPLPAALRAFEFHATLLKTKSAVTRIHLVLHHLVHDGGVRQSVLELYTIISDLN